MLEDAHNFDKVLMDGELSSRSVCNDKDLAEYESPCETAKCNDNQGTQFYSSCAMELVRASWPNRIDNMQVVHISSCIQSFFDTPKPEAFFHLVITDTDYVVECLKFDTSDELVETQHAILEQNKDAGINCHVILTPHYTLQLKAMGVKESDCDFVYDMSKSALNKSQEIFSTQYNKYCEIIELKNSLYGECEDEILYTEYNKQESTMTQLETMEQAGHHYSKLIESISFSKPVKETAQIQLVKLVLELMETKCKRGELSIDDLKQYFSLLTGDKIEEYLYLAWGKDGIASGYELINIGVSISVDFNMTWLEARILAKVKNDKADEIVIVHNHPLWASSHPSNEDIDISKQLNALIESRFDNEVRLNFWIVSALNKPFVMPF